MFLWACFITVAHGGLSCGLSHLQMWRGAQRVAEKLVAQGSGWGPASMERALGRSRASHKDSWGSGMQWAIALRYDSACATSLKCMVGKTRHNKEALRSKEEEGRMKAWSQGVCSSWESSQQAEGNSKQVFSGKRQRWLCCSRRASEAACAYRQCTLKQALWVNRE